MSQFGSPRISSQQPLTLPRSVSPPRSTQPLSLPRSVSPPRSTQPLSLPRSVSPVTNHILPRAVAPVLPRAVSPTLPRAVLPTLPRAVSPTLPRAVLPTLPRAVSPTLPRAVSPGVASSNHTNWFKPDSGLSEDQRKYCSCVIQVAAKQPAACLEEEAWRERREGKVCANPYPVCAKSIGTTSRGCGQAYNFEAIPDLELRGYARLNRIPIPEPYQRQNMLRNIQQWKTQKGY